MSDDRREMTLIEWCAKLPDSHLVNRELADLKSRLAAAEAVLTHISEYWNRDQNETAMADALWHIIDAAEVAADAARGGE